MVENNFEFRLVNPILINRKISSSICKKKTDKNDAKLIAQIARQGEGRVVTLEQLNVSRRTLLRTRTSLVNQRTGIKIILKELKIVGKNDKKIRVAMKSLEKLIGQMDKCVENVKQLALDKKEKTNEEKLIQTLPGFANRLSAIVSIETGDFSRFPTATQYKAYVGIDPRVIQSGIKSFLSKEEIRGQGYKSGDYRRSQKTLRESFSSSLKENFV